MIDLRSDDIDAIVVEALISGAARGMQTIKYEPSDSEVLTAAVTLLDRTLRSIRKLQSDEDRFKNAGEIRRVLGDLMTDHGSVPS